MDAREVPPTSPRAGSISNGISFPPAASAEACSPRGHSGSWGGFDSAFETPIGDLNILENIDPRGLYRAPLARQYIQGPPVPQVVIPPPVIIRERSAIAARYEAEFRRLELALASLDVSVTLDQKATEEEVQITDHVNILQQNISTPGMDVNTATCAPFIVPMPENADIPPTTPIVIDIPKLVVSALEPIGHQTRAAVEKVQENIEVIPVNLEHNSFELSSTEGSSSLGSSV